MIEVYKHSPNAIIPTRSHKTDAGLDLYALEDVRIVLGTTVVVDTGISVHIQDGYVGKIEDRSSLAKEGLRTGGGVIDAGYNGSIKVVLHNVTSKRFLYHDGTWGININAGERIAQLLIYKVDTTGVMETRFLWDSDRSGQGFGSSNP